MQYGIQKLKHNKMPGPTDNLMQNVSQKIKPKIKFEVFLG